MAENSYKSIAKGTAVFGGTQVFNILIGLLRGKLVAVFLGPEGMGISALLTSAMTTIQQFTNLGLSFSVVREVSISYDKDGNKSSENSSKTIYVARALLKLTAIIGALCCVLFSSALSKYTFGNNEYKWHFIALSLVVFFTTIGNGEQAILQGAHALKRLAYSSIVGSTAGLLIGVPLYYFYGYDGIVPAMIVLSMVSFLFYRYGTYKLVATRKESIDFGSFYRVAKTMVALGIVLMVAQLLGTLATYLINSFIRWAGSVSDVGLYQAANSLSSQYVGLVFTAMSLDYFPRLSAIHNDKHKMRQVVTEQTEIVALVVAPLAAILILSAPIVIKVLLTDNFYSIVDLVRIMGVALLFKALAYPMGYISFAKGDKKTFFWLEGVWSNTLHLLFGCFFYHMFGIKGLGFSVLTTNTIALFVYLIVTKRLYDFHYTKNLMKLQLVLILLMALIYFSSMISNLWYSYLLMTLLTLFTVALSLKGLNDRLGLLNIIKRKKHEY